MIDPMVETPGIIIGRQAVKEAPDSRVSPLNTEVGYEVGPRLREFRLLAPSGRRACGEAT